MTATFDGLPYRGSIVRMGGGAVLGVQKAIMAQAGVSVGETLTVVVRNDDTPREVEVPDDLAEALRPQRRGSRGVRGSLVTRHRREYVDAINEAKRPETRARRIERTIRGCCSSGLGRLSPRG